MKIFFLIAIFLCVFLSFGFKNPKETKEVTKPNIVLLFIDDWAWNGTPISMDEGMSNSKMPLLQMPNLDKLASEGMKFRNAYAGAPQCAPSRVCLQTGKSAPRNGFTVFMNNGGSDYYDNNKAYNKFPVIPCVSDMTIDDDAVTIPEALKPLGYECAHLGKWHMRGNPEEEGYDLHDGATTNKEGNQKFPGDPKLMFSITKRGIDFMEEQVKKGKPFYLQLSYYAMHAGYECLPETREKYAKMPAIQAYYQKVGKTAETIERGHQDPATWMGMGENLDGRIGAVLNKIKELSVEDNTYIIMASDNGYRHFFYPWLTQPLHGGKWWVWQGGIRVPMLAKGPGIKPGTVCNENVVNYDFLPTFIDWAGGQPHQLKDIDGVSLAGIMRGERATQEFHNRNLYFHYPHYRVSMPISAIVSGKRKVMHFYEQPDVPMMFDLSTDEGEVKNIAASDPIEHDVLFNEMMQYLKKVDARLPRKNPDYDPTVYKQAKEYDTRVMWGPFTGERPLEKDEK